MESKYFNMYETPYHFRVNQPDINSNPSIYVMIHGWSGNENSMSIFESTIPNNSLIISPRGNLKISEKQYGWINPKNNEENEFDFYRNIAINLFNSTRNIIHQLIKTDFQKLNLIGFSQGSSICSVLGFLFPEYFSKIALLSGYLPKNFPTSVNNGINTIQFFISHGTEDAIVNFSKAIEMEGLLRGSGAEVELCTSKVAHKVSSDCLRDLRLFLSD